MWPWLFFFCFCLPCLPFNLCSCTTELGSQPNCVSATIFLLPFLPLTIPATDHGTQPSAVTDDDRVSYLGWVLSMPWQVCGLIGVFGYVFLAHLQFSMDLRFSVVFLNRTLLLSYYYNSTLCFCFGKLPAYQYHFRAVHFQLEMAWDNGKILFLCVKSVKEIVWHVSFLGDTVGRQQWL